MYYIKALKILTVTGLAIVITSILSYVVSLQVNWTVGLRHFEKLK